MNSRRPRPYVWVSWITALLAGTDQCHWKVWTKANFRYAKLAGDGGFDLAEWTKQHDEMVNTRVAKLKLEGYDVRVEEENSFKLDGERGTLAGKPDIIALKAAEKYALIIDAKSGKEKPADRWQVKIYIFAKRLLSLKDWRVDGEIQYRGRQERIPFLEVDALAMTRIADTMKMATGEIAPQRTPSQSECKWCDIADCPDRYAGTGAKPEVADVKDIF